MISIVAAADLHLGKRVTPLPTGIDCSIFSPKSAWSALVDYTLSIRADLLMIAGDLVDRDNDFFESFVPFSQGIQKLEAAGIPVVIVAGNHDAEILPKLIAATECKNLIFLGKQGKWESCELTLSNHKVRIDGFSFAASIYKENPFDSYDLIPPEGIALGLIHGECPGVPGSPYAPIQLANFDRYSHLAWAMGHHHRPVALSEKVFYCGSTMPLDQSELGAHGAFLLTIDPVHLKVERTLIPLALLRFEQVRLCVEELTGDSFENKLIDLLKELDSQLGEDASELCGCHLILEGAVENFSHLKMALFEKFLEMKGQICFAHYKRYFIHKMSDQTVPYYDLKSLAKEVSLPGAIAKLLLDKKKSEQLTEQLKQLLATSLSSQVFADFDIENIDKSLLDEKVKAAGHELLQALLQQKSGEAL